MVEGVAISTGYAGTRPVTVPAAPSSCLDSPLQPGGEKSAPLTRRGVGDGGGAGGRGPYVHTPIGTSSPQVFFGRTVDGIERKRKRERFKHIAACALALIHGGEEDAGKALLSCGRYFKCAVSPCGDTKLIPFPCDSFFCPECAGRRSKPLQERISKKLNQTDHDYFFLTITVKNWERLTNEAVKQLVGQFAKLRETDEWKAEVSGGAYSVESTFNRSKSSWHPHLHVLIETRKRLPMDWIDGIRAHWRSITGSHVLRLEKMYGTDKKGRKTRKVNKRAIRELVKYATKTADFSDRTDCVLEFYRAFKGVRRMQCFGSFLGVDKEAEKEADPSHPENLVGCSCGLCKWADMKFIRKVHISETILLSNGTRQLKLFDSDTGPPDYLAAKDWISEKEFQAQELKKMQPVLFAGPLFDGPSYAI